MIKLENIHPLTDFKRNAKAFVARIKATKSPIVLTVNGKAELVIQDAATFQEMAERLQQVEDVYWSCILKVELTGVEPVSALGISTPFIHRFSFSDPRSGNRPLSRTVGCSGKGLARYRPEAVG